jgi:hypothetical protein
MHVCWLRDLVPVLTPKWASDWGDGEHLPAHENTYERKKKGEHLAVMRT